MDAMPIDGATRRLGAPTNWDHEKDGICHTLEILDHDGWMISAWMPSEIEIKAINAGSPVLLYVQGKAHPVVSLAVAALAVPQAAA